MEKYCPNDKAFIFILPLLYLQVTRTGMKSSFKYEPYLSTDFAHAFIMGECNKHISKASWPVVFKFTM